MPQGPILYLFSDFYLSGLFWTPCVIGFPKKTKNLCSSTAYLALKLEGRINKRSTKTGEVLLPFVTSRRAAFFHTLSEKWRKLKMYRMCHLSFPMREQATGWLEKDKTLVHLKEHDIGP